MDLGCPDRFETSFLTGEFWFLLLVALQTIYSYVILYIDPDPRVLDPYHEDCMPLRVAAKSRTTARRESPQMRKVKFNEVRMARVVESRDLFAIVVFVVISAIFIIVPPLNETPLRAVLGFILVLFVPGYVFVSALFPGSDEVDGIVRLALSIGLSICIVIFIGIALNYSPWGIRQKPILLSISAFTLATTAICAYRRVKIATQSKAA